MRLLKAIGQRFNRNSRKNNKQTKHENASIVDFGDKVTLTMAMGGGKGRRTSHSGTSVGASSLAGDDDPSMSSFGDYATVEWTLPLVDKETSVPQNMEEEMKRLEVLNSYFVLDSKGEEEFDRITRLGAKLFDVPMCVISLVDLGRQWFLSKVGLDAVETHRKHAFCAHVILNKHKLLVIPDATKDFRFKDNPLVTGGPEIRFYAGAALVSKEGYKLGTLCVISPIARPAGLTAEQRSTLCEMADMVISTMESRRTRLLKEEYEVKFHHLARTFLDTTHHLEVANNSVQKVLVKNSWGMEPDEEEALSMASRILDMQSKMCTAAMRTTLQDTPVPVPTDKVDDDEDEDGCLDKDAVIEEDKIDNPTTNLLKLFDNVNSIVSSFPRQGDVSVEIDKSLPRSIGCDDLLLFRAILNILTHCMGASPEGEACGVRMRRMKKEEDELLIQCLLGGPIISKKDAKALYENRESLLAPVASIVRSMGGHFGMFEAKWDTKTSGAPVHSIFWFQIPYERLDKNGTLKHCLRKTHPKPEEAKSELLSPTIEKVKSDPFHAALIENGCGRLPIKN